MIIIIIIVILLMIILILIMIMPIIIMILVIITGAPAMVISRLMVCSEDVQTELHASIKGFAHKNFIGLGVPL